MTGGPSEGNPLRIAFLLHSFPEWSETFLLRQIVGLLDRGHQVELFCREEGRGIVVHEAVERYHLLDRVRHVDAARGGSARLARGWGALALVARNPRLAQWLCSQGRGAVRDGTLLRLAAALSRWGPFDIVHAHYGDVALRLGPAAEFAKAPLVASFYGYDCSSYPRRHGREVFGPLFARAAMVTGLSTAMMERLRELGCPAPKVRRHRIGVDVRRFRPAPRPSSPPSRLLTVARLVEKKGVETVIRALGLLGEEFPGLLYDVVGDGPLRPRLERLSEEAGLSARIRFHGAQSEDRIVTFMQASDCFVLASARADDGDEEGTPTVLMEASSMGLPVVSTWHAGIPEVVLDGETGLLAPPGDPPALADRLRRLLRDPDLGRRLGERGRARMEEHFDVPLLTRRLEALYREVIAGSADGRLVSG